ncbi:MAG TPA: putative glycoside hydrolase [Chloroflexia bacterium]|nr:putative glycoside hydrolase [Chloroflexia bacterium]
MPSRRRRLSSLPSPPKRTPTFVYVVLALLCLGGLYVSKQNLVKHISGTVVDAYTGQPLAGVTLDLTNDTALAKTAGISLNDRASTDNEGKFDFPKATDNYSLTAQLNNYRKAEVKQSSALSTDVKLVPSILRGQIKDQNGNGIASAYVTLGDLSVETAADGSYSFSNPPESGTINAHAAGFRRGTAQYSRTVRADVTLQPFQVKAVYLDPADIATPGNLNNFLNSITNTGITAVIVDLKDESGKVLYDSKLPLAQTLLAGNDKRIPSLAALLKTLQDHKLYTIGRIVCFKDPVMTDIKPDWTLKSRSTGKPWADAGGYNWINPYKRDSWDYYLGLAEEAGKAGFDEIQFDTLHFPVLGKLDDIDYQLQDGRTSNASTRQDTINAFLKAARDKLSPLGVYTSVNVLGSALIENDDLGIGMSVTAMAPNVDYISPLIYPVEWQDGAFGIPKPTENPYELVRQSMLSAQSQLKERVAQVRPWLQDFSRGDIKYDETKVRDEIRAIEEFQQKGGSGWILYNPNSKYTVSALNVR